MGFTSSIPVAYVQNPAGTLTPQLFHAIKNQMQQSIINGKKTVIIIRGEDDLSTLAAIYIAPLLSVVLYGQPHEGMVVVEVTEAKKEEVTALLSQFE